MAYVQLECVAGKLIADRTTLTAPVRSAFAHPFSSADVPCQALTRVERQLRTSALRLPGKRRGNRAATNRPALKIERLGIRVGIDGDFRGPTASRGFQGMRKERPADAQVHE